MKQASLATLAILASGQFKRADLYEITLAGGIQKLHFTSAQRPLTVGGVVYQTGLSITRGTLKQEVGMTVDTLQLTIQPQDDSTFAPVLLAGYPFLEGCKRKVLDGTRILFSKMFLNTFDDTSPGATPFFQGRVNKVTVDRFTATIYVNSDIEMLNVQMPRNLYQPACLHTLFDAGCGLSASTFQVSSTFASGSDTTTLHSNLTQADDYFTLGRITITSGILAGVSRNVKHYLQGQGLLYLPYPLPSPPVPGTTFVALPGCDKTTPTCRDKFNNLSLHNRSYPFIPVPETLYDSGGTIQTSRKDLGGQGGPKTGSSAGGASGSRTFVP